MKDESGPIWGRVGRSLLGNALYFAGCGAASCAVFGCEQGLIVGALSPWLLPIEPIASSSPFVLTGLFGAGIGGIIGALAALPAFFAAGILRGASPLALQRDEVARACKMARHAALICGVAGVFSGPLLSFLTRVPLWALWPFAAPAAGSQQLTDLIIGGALSGLIVGNVIGLWLGAIFPSTIETLYEKHWWRDWLRLRNS